MGFCQGVAVFFRRGAERLVGMVAWGGSRGGHERRSGVFDRSGQAHIRGLVTSRPLFVAGLAF